MSIDVNFYPGWVRKSITFTIDDGNVVLDRKFMNYVKPAGIKGTFNIIGNHYGSGDPNRLSYDDLKELFFPKGHEVANHCMHHAAPINLTPVEGMREVIEGRRAAETFYDRILRGFAYPDRTETNETIKSYLRMSGTAYARATEGTGTFALPKDFYNWLPTCKHTDENALALAQTFLDADPRAKYCSQRDSLLFFVWGHSFECPADDFRQFEALCALLGGHEDIWYAPCIDICDYIRTYDSLIASVDNTLLFNPSPLRVWLDWDEKRFTVGPGETIRIG